MNYRQDNHHSLSRVSLAALMPIPSSLPLSLPVLLLMLVLLLVTATPTVVGAAGKISGIFVDIYQQPIGGVEVELQGATLRKMVKSDDQTGKFTFTDVPAGRHRISWEKFGWEFMGGPSRAVKVYEGQEVPVTVEARIFWWAELMRSYVAVVALALLIVAHVCFLINIFVLPRPALVLSFFGGFFVCLSSFLILTKLETSWKPPLMVVVVVSCMITYYLGKNRANQPAVASDLAEAAEREKAIETKEKEREALLESLIGKQGETVSCLKLFGKIQVDGRTFDAKSAHGFMEKGVKVAVAAREADYFVVEPVPPSTSA